MNWLKRWWSNLWKKTDTIYTYYEVDWDKVRTLKDLLFVLEHYTHTQPIRLSEEIVMLTPHWKNLTIKRKIQL